MLKPGDNLIVEGIPAIPASLADEAAVYNNFRYASFQGWHPLNREMIISTRFGDTSQVHQVKAPGAARTQLTFFKDRVSSPSYDPLRGDFIVFSKDRGGDENFQMFRYDFASGKTTLLTDGRSRNIGGVWSNRATGWRTNPTAAMKTTSISMSWTRAIRKATACCCRCRAAPGERWTGRPTTACSWCRRASPSTRATCGWWTALPAKRNC